jgi:NADH-quinone oxidoreductase subunit M
VELGLSLLTLAWFTRGEEGVQLAERAAWIPALDISYHVGVDGISVLFVPMTALLTLLVMVASWRSARTRVRAFHIAFFGLQATVMGIFCSLDTVLFFVFWEASLVPIYFLVSLWGVGPERRYAAMKFVLTMLVASGPLLLGIVLLGVHAHMSGGPYTFDWLALRASSIPPRLQTVVFFLLLAGFAVKGPFFPLHTWMPAMLRECPVGIGVIVTGLKLGSYGVLRFIVPLLPEATARFSWLLGVIGVLGILYGALVSIVQPNLRRLLSFSCLCHVGYILLGISSRTPQGLSGAVLAMVNLGLSSTGLFFLTGFLQARVGSSEISALGGVAKRAPIAAAFFLLLGLAGIGLPGTSGFPGEHLVLLGAYRMGAPLLLPALLGTVLGAAYTLRVFERAFLGPATRPRVLKMKDLAPEEWGVLACLGALVLLIGVYPAPLVRIVDASVAGLTAAPFKP